MSNDYDIKNRFGNNKLWCNKTLISGKKWIQMLFSFILFTAPYVLFVFVLAKTNENGSSIAPIVVSSVLYLISMFAMLRGGFTDPGILARHRGNDFFNPKRTNLPQLQNGQMVTLTYCYTCYLFRPPRTSHCAVCDNCIERFDHHCLWLGNCVGKRNYKFFYLFVFTLNVTALFEIGYSIYLIVFQFKSIHRKEELTNIVLGCLSAVLFFDLMFLLFFLGKLFILHTILLLKNVTFYEYYKKKWKIPPAINPFFKNAWTHFYRLIIKMTPQAFLNLKENNEIISRVESENFELPNIENNS